MRVLNLVQRCSQGGVEVKSEATLGSVQEAGAKVDSNKAPCAASSSKVGVARSAP